MIDTPCSPTHTLLALAYTLGKTERDVAEKRLNSWYVTCFSSSTNPGNLSQQDLLSLPFVNFPGELRGSNTHTHGSFQATHLLFRPGPVSAERKVS